MDHFRRAINEVFPRLISTAFSEDPSFSSLLPIPNDISYLSQLFRDQSLLSKVIDILFPAYITQYLETYLEEYLEQTKNSKIHLTTKQVQSPVGFIILLTTNIHRKDNLLAKQIIYRMEPNMHISDEEMLPRRDISDLSPTEILLRWCRFLLQKARWSKRVSSMNELFDTKIYAIIMHQIQPDICSAHLVEMDEYQRSVEIFQNATKLGCAELLSPSALLCENEFFHLSFLYRLFFRYAFQKIYPSVDLLEGDGKRFLQLLRYWTPQGTTQHILPEEFRDAYEPLDENRQETRLLVIFPNTDKEAELETGLLHVSLKENMVTKNGRPIDYAILSYVWGPFQKTRTILVNNKKLPVTENLFQALKKYREEKSVGFLWADAICINQEDKLERSYQVSLMADLYRRSLYVVAWLGPEADDAMDFLELWEKTRYNSSERIDFASMKAFWRLLVSDQHDKQWQAINEFLQRDYWTRAWTLQEVLLAKSCVIYCENRSTSLPSLTSLVTACHKYAKPQMKGQWQIATKARRAIELSLWVAELRNRQTKKIPLVEALVLGRARQATVGSDKVYAFLGLVDTTIYPIEINYKEPLMALSRRTALQAIQSDGNLDILSACTPQPASNNLWPSWLPDWTIPISKESYLFLGHVNYDSKPAIYSAGGNSTPTINTELQTPFLGVMGLEFDIIERELQLGAAWNALYIAWRDHLYGGETLSEKRNPYLDELGLQKAFGNLMLLGRDHYGNKNKADKPFRLGCVFLDGEFPLQVPEGFHDSLATHTNVMSDPIRPSTSSREDKMKFLGLNAESYSHWEDSYSKILHLMEWGYGVFMTNKGFLGRALNRLKTGDRICVFVGAKTPFVLRDAGDNSFYLIGECYVQGIMDGEALEQPHVLKEFKLR